MSGWMEESDWRRIEHPELDRLASVILSAVWAGAASLRALTRKRYGLDLRWRVDPSQAPEPIWRFFEYLPRLFDLPVPELYAQPSEPGWIVLANCFDEQSLAPAMVVRQRCFASAQPSALAFTVGQKLAALRPEWYLALALPEQELDIAFWAAVGLVQPDAAIPKRFRSSSYAATVKLRSLVPEQHLEPLAEVVARLYSRGFAPDLRAWRGAVLETCDRAGMIACGDLDGAELVIRDPRVPPDQAETRFRQLELFSVSLEYFELREKLGLEMPAE